MANRYLIAGSVLDADVLISVPKLKTHSKVGVTVNCKGMVGINGNKNRLPHYRVGNVSEGGDQFPDGLVSSANTRRMHMGRVLGEILTKQQTIWADSLSWAIQSIAGIVGTSVLRLPDLDPLMAESGNWPGNDTCWRLAADLARIAVFADRDGVMQMTPQRRFLSIVDGIVGGEGDGPLNARPKPCGVLLAGMHPVATDLVSSHLMGLDWRRIPYLRELSEGFCADLEPGFGSVSSQEINTFSNFQPWMNLFDSPVDDLLNFEPPSRWVGQIELRR
jgi:hypothetical protein